MSAREHILSLIESAPADDAASLQLPFVADHTSKPTIYANERGIVIWVNRAARDLFGMTFAQMTEHPVTALIPERFVPAHEAAYSKRVSDELASHVANMTVKDATIQSFARRADGTEIPVVIKLSSYRHNGSITFAASVEPRNDDAA